jgi:multidrug resistance efflux pump
MARFLAQPLQRRHVALTYCHVHLLLQMRNAIKASRNGYVDEVLVKEGQIVSADQPLLRFW